MSAGKVVFFPATTLLFCLFLVVCITANNAAAEELYYAVRGGVGIMSNSKAPTREASYGGQGKVAFARGGGAQIGSTQQLGAWRAITREQDSNGECNDAYLQIDFHSFQLVAGVVTQGRDAEGANEWVKSYNIQVVDSETQLWEIVKSTEGGTDLFQGNSDASTSVERKFANSVFTRSIRIYPLTYSGWCSLRWDAIIYKTTTATDSSTSAHSFGTLSGVVPLTISAEKQLPALDSGLALLVSYGNAPFNFQSYGGSAAAGAAVYRTTGASAGVPWSPSRSPTPTDSDPSYLVIHFNGPQAVIGIIIRGDGSGNFVSRVRLEFSLGNGSWSSQIHDGNTDSSTPQVRYLSGDAIVTTALRVIPTTCDGSRCSIGAVEALVLNDPQIFTASLSNQLLENDTLPSDSREAYGTATGLAVVFNSRAAYLWLYSAMSYHSVDSGGFSLFSEAAGAAWIPDGGENSDRHFVQFNMFTGEDVAVVTGIATQGRGNWWSPSWVIAYEVEAAVGNGTWKKLQVRGSAENDFTFPGNSDSDSLAVRMFAHPVRTRAIRVIPTVCWKNVLGQPQCPMRADLLLRTWPKNFETKTVGLPSHTIFPDRTRSLTPSEEEVLKSEPSSSSSLAMDRQQGGETSTSGDSGSVQRSLAFPSSTSASSSSAFNSSDSATRHGSDDRPTTSTPPSTRSGGEAETTSSTSSSSEVRQADTTDLTMRKGSTSSTTNRTSGSTAALAIAVPVLALSIFALVGLAVVFKKRRRKNNNDTSTTSTNLERDAAYRVVDRCRAEERHEDDDSKKDGKELTYITSSGEIEEEVQAAEDGLQYIPTVEGNSSLSLANQTTEHITKEDLGSSSVSYSQGHTDGQKVAVDCGRRGREEEMAHVSDTDKDATGVFIQPSETSASDNNGAANPKTSTPKKGVLGANNNSGGSNLDVSIVGDGGLHFSFKKGKCIGQGGFGTVYLARNDTYGGLLAAKQLKVQSQMQNQHGGRKKNPLRELAHEVKSMKKLDHPNIVKYLGFKHDAAEDEYFILMEYLPGGSLKSNIQSFGRLSLPVASHYTNQALTGLVYLHSQGIVHRDIKAANMLLGSDDMLKLSDLGACKPTDHSASFIGTPNWMAPEILSCCKEKDKLSTACDVWALGCTVMEMLTGKNPFEWTKLSPFAVMNLVGSGGENFEQALTELGNIIGERRNIGFEFILACLEWDPKKRPTASELLKHPFSNIDFEERMSRQQFKERQQQRGGADTVEGTDSAPQKLPRTTRAARLSSADSCSSNNGDDDDDTSHQSLPEDSSPSASGGSKMMMTTGHLPDSLDVTEV